jgi:hypothetical protein
MRNRSAFTSDLSCLIYLRRTTVSLEGDVYFSSLAVGVVGPGRLPVYPKAAGEGRPGRYSRPWTPIPASVQ